MSSILILPLEIEEKILDLLAEDDNDHSALKTCSLVCQAFLPICRKHIFGSIALNDYQTPSPPTTHALALLLSRRPEIADYIRKLDYTIETADVTSPLIQESLKRISRLESLLPSGMIVRKDSTGATTHFDQRCFTSYIFLLSLTSI